MTVKTAEYPISSNYCAKWSIIEGIREIIANALDTKQVYTVGWENGYGYVEDYGTGFPKECLILGEGEVKDETQIGQFREGLKIAGLVFARENRSFLGETVGYSFSFRMANSDMFNCKTLFVDIDNNDKKYGTKVIFECSKSELDIAKSLFLSDDREDAYIVPHRPGELFINKVFVYKIDNSLFGYNLTDKDAANRDRSVLNMENVKSSISKIWETIEDPNLITEYLTSREQHIEHEIAIRVQSKLKPIWIKEIEKIYGKKYCIYDTSEYAHQVAEWGYNVINPLTYNMKWIMNSYLDIPYCKEILEKSIEENYTDFFPNLTPQQMKTYNMALSIVELYVEEPLNVMVVEKISYLEDNDAVAKADRENKRILITPTEIDKGIKKLAGTIIHENTHLIKGHSDSTRAFENDLTDIIGDLLVKLNKGIFARERENPFGYA